MEDIGRLLTNPLALCVAALVVLLAALGFLFKELTGRTRRLSGRLDEIAAALAGQMSSANQRTDEQARRGREELSTNLRGMSDSVTRVMSDMARTQQAQLDAFAGQLREMSRVDEERMDGMRQTVEARLVAYEDRMDHIGEILDEKLEKNDARVERMRATIAERMEKLQSDNGARLDEMRQSVETRLAAYEDRMDSIGAILDEKLEKNDERVERMRQTIEERMEKLQSDNGARLDEMRRTVDERLNATLDKRLGESFRLVSDRLDQVYRGLGEMQSIASGMGDLKRVLTNVKSRGLLGEIQLGALLRQILTNDQYMQDAVLRPDGEAVNFAIKLPAHGPDEQPCLLPIDARFPQEAYIRLMDAMETGNAQEIEQMAGELEGKLVKAAERIRDQFISPPATTDFAVLFLPSEGLYAEVLRRPELCERLQRDYHVTLTGPSTLSALLNSLQMGFKTLAIEKRSEEVWALLGAVKGEFVHFADALARTQKRIRQASESIEDAARKSRTIERKLKGVEKLKGPERQALLEDEDDGLYESGDWD